MLDACAAPGGKTGHLLELHDGRLELVAVERETARAERIHQNLRRLGLTAQVLVADATRHRQWWDGRPFQRILLDAPCSGTGVIRRHPDIKWLRRPHDITQLAQRQARLLDTLWPLLCMGGRLVDATCSVLPQENELQIRAFLERHPDAALHRIDGAWGHAERSGRQVLPGEDEMDGFYYACLAKH